MMDDGLQGVFHVLKVRCKSPHQGWLVWMISGPAAASPAVAAVSAPCAIRHDARHAHPGRYVPRRSGPFPQCPPPPVPTLKENLAVVVTPGRTVSYMPHSYLRAGPCQVIWGPPHEASRPARTRLALEALGLTFVKLPRNRRCARGLMLFSPQSSDATFHS